MGKDTVSQSAPGAAAATSPPRRRTQIERTAESDQRMFQATIQLLIEGGTHGTTLKEVGERAGYSRGLASGRFGSKEDLFSALFAECDRKWNIAAKSFVGDKKGLDAFSASMEAVQSFMINETEYMRAMFIIYYETLSNANLLKRQISDHLLKYRRDIVRWIDEAIAAGSFDPAADSEIVALHYCSFLIGFIYHWLVIPETLDVKQCISTFRNLLLRSGSSETSRPTSLNRA